MIRAFCIGAFVLTVSACGTVVKPGVCGNGVVDGNEFCDDGNTDGSDSCASDCQAGCGDGEVAADEICDDSNTEGGDGCSADCQSDETCGNTIVDVDEACDDGDTEGGDGCSADCLSDETCGNQILDPTEACDDGNTAEHDGCNAVCTGAFREFDGTNTGGWVLAAHVPGSGSFGSGIVDYIDASTPYVYTFIQFGNDFRRIDPATGDSLDVADPSPPLGDAQWATPAADGHFFYVMRTGSIHRFDLTDESWSVVGNFTDVSDVESMNESDGAGHIYTMADHNMVEYDIASGNLNYYPVDAAIDISEARLAYDPTHHAMFFGGYGSPDLHRMDLTTHEVTAVASIPEDQLNDIFCGDRSGHIYAAGASGGVTLFVYDIETNMWAPIPDFPVDEGNAGGCMVSALDGKLYMTPAYTDELYALALN